jgi:cytochrome c-type biogenesis protein CcmH/NrfG
MRAVRKNPGDPLGWNRLGHLFLRIGKIVDAQSAFQRAAAA